MKENKKEHKQRISATISPEMYDYIKDLGINLSGFIENAIQNLKNGLGESPSALGMILVHPVSKDSQVSITSGISPQNPSVCEMSLSEPGEKHDVSITDVKDGDCLPADAGYSMAVWFVSWQSKWERWMKNRGTKPKTVAELVRDARKLTWLYDVESIKDVDDVTKHDNDAVYSVCAFIDSEVPAAKGSFNGFTTSLYRQNIKQRYKPKKGTRYEQKSHDLILHPNVVSGTLDLLPPDIQAFFVIIAVTGARAEQLVRLYQKPLKIIKHDGFFRIDARAAAQGQKQTTEYFLPAEYLPIVEEFHPGNPARYYADNVNHRARDIDNAIPCNLSSLRKFTKQVFSESDMSESAAEYTQGRKPDGVGAKAYDNLQVKAIREYPKVIPLWKKYMPLPQWMTDRKQIQKKLGGKK